MGKLASIPEASEAPIVIGVVPEYAAAFSE
jgi:hypothetical protein